MSNDSKRTPQIIELQKYIDSNVCRWSIEPDPSGEQWGIHQQDTPPHNRLLGSVFARGGCCGLIQHQGETLMQWGDIDRPDMTFSVSKTYLAITAGVAFDQGLLGDLDAPVAKCLSAAGVELGFSSDHNKEITWRHLMQFTSEWEGGCFGVPDQVDRYRQVKLHDSLVSGQKGDARPLQTPGSFWEYNDVRINQFSLALLHLFKRPLPEVFREYIMQPLGASDSWQWHGYNNSWVSIAGRQLQSVPGGGHWGGGVCMSARDQALVGQLLLNDGVAGDRRLLSSEWLRQMREPCSVAPHYGFFTWLNTGHCISASVSEDSYFALGIGGQMIWHDPLREVIAVFRWVEPESLDELLTRVLAILPS